MQIMLAMGSTTFLLKLPIYLPNFTSGVQFGRINRNWIVLNQRRGTKIMLPPRSP
jgi:hypothetical protein